MKKTTVKLTDNEKKKIQFVISCHLDGVPSLKDIEIMDTEKGYFPYYDHIRVKRFDTARKGWTDGYFHISLIGKENVVVLFFGDSEDPARVERRFYFPKEGASPSYEWNFLDSNIKDEENGIKFLNRFPCLSSCGVEPYLCTTECSDLYEDVGRLNDIDEEEEEEC